MWRTTRSAAGPLRHGHYALIKGEHRERGGVTEVPATRSWLVAHRIYGGSRYAQLAEAAANHVWQSRESIRVNGSLCCGFAGQGYALLGLYRATGDTMWLKRAETICEEAIAVAHRSSRRASLYKGDIGIALLAEELLKPEDSCMPMFESERWGGP